MVSGRISIQSMESSNHQPMSQRHSRTLIAKKIESECRHDDGDEVIKLDNRRNSNITLKSKKIIKDERHVKGIKRKTINNSFEYGNNGSDNLSDVGDPGAKQDGLNPFEPTEAEAKGSATELQLIDKQTACGTFISSELKKLLPPLPVNVSMYTQQRNAS